MASEIEQLFQTALTTWEKGDRAGAIHELERIEAIAAGLDTQVSAALIRAVRNFFARLYYGK